MIHKNYDKDPDTALYIKEAKERGDSNYQQLYDEYLQPKEMNFKLKAIINKEGLITLYSNFSPEETEWKEVKMSNFIISEKGNGLNSGDINMTDYEKLLIFTYLKYIQNVSDDFYKEYFTISPTGAHSIVCKITEDGVTTEKAEDLSIDSNRIDDTDITDFYSLFSKAQEAWGWFYVDTMPLKGTPALPLIGIMTESGECFEVDYEGIETMKDLENYLKTIFSDEKVECMLKTERYFDVDGKLCAIVMSRGTNHSYGKIVEVIKNNINEYQIEYTVSVEKLDDNYEVEEYKSFNFILERTGDRWVFSDFPTWW